MSDAKLLKLIDFFVHEEREAMSKAFRVRGLGVLSGEYLAEMARARAMFDAARVTESRLSKKARDGHST